METILAAQVPTGPTTDSTADSSPDSSDGELESFVGRGTHCQRAAREAGYSGFFPNGKQVPSESTYASAERRHAMVDFSALARSRDHCL
jgi:hypothetical protein